MSKGDLSTFCSLWFLSSVVCSFPCTGHSHPLWSLFWDILFFWGYCKWSFKIFISFSNCSLLVCRKATDFCKLILYPANFLKLFMVSRSFLVEFFGSFWYKVLSPMKRDSLTSSLPIYISFISSSCLISLARLCSIGVEIVVTLASFLTLGEMVSVFPRWVWC
jgi:hypothetical protein